VLRKKGEKKEGTLAGHRFDRHQKKEKKGGKKKRWLRQIQSNSPEKGIEKKGKGDTHPQAREKGKKKPAESLREHWLGEGKEGTAT